MILLKLGMRLNEKVYKSVDFYSYPSKELYGFYLKVLLVLDA